MSDVHVDKLNNSQLILLILLISLVVSAAVSVATLSVVYGRLALDASTETERAQPTVIQQTINRIIERNPDLSADEALAIVDVSVPDQGGLFRHSVLSSGVGLSPESIEKALVTLYFGSQPFAPGVYVSPEGLIVSSELLDTERRYSIPNPFGDMMYFSVIYTDGRYSLLAPMREHAVSQHVSLGSPDISLGQAAFVFGGFADEAEIHVGVVSRKETSSEGMTSFRLSPNLSSVSHTSAAFVGTVFVGFAEPFSDRIFAVTPEFVQKSQESYDHIFDGSS